LTTFITAHGIFLRLGKKYPAANLAGAEEQAPISEPYFQCRTYRTRGKAYCSQHRINAPDLEEAVLGDIRLHAESVINDKERFIKDTLKDMGSMNCDRSKSLSDRVRKLKAEVAEADERYVKLYDDLSNGIILESKFKLLYGKIEERQKVALSEIERLEEQLKTSEADAEAVELFAEQLADATRIKELSSELLNRLVDKNEVSKKECADGETVQKV
jgi:predicted metal-binding transcription factor (methanogenesis marker protein 9)